MMRRAVPFALFTLALLPLVPGAARAQTTPEGAQALEQQIHQWITSTLGPDVKIAQRPVQVTADGDHYDIAIPLGDAADAPRWTATARERSGGRYAVDDMHMPSPAEFHVKLPEALMPNAPPGTSTDVTYKINIGQQNGQMLIDPTFASPTTSSSSVKGVDVQTTGGMSPQTTHIDSGTGSFSMQPTADGRVDISIDSSLDGYTVDTTLPNAGPMKLGFGKTHVTANATSLSRARAVEVLQDVIKLGKAMSAKPGDANTGAGASSDPATLLLAAFADLASGASLDETLQNATVDIGGMAGTLRAAQIGFAVKGVGGILQGRLDLGAEGLTLPDLGLGAMAELIPTKISLRPTIAGLPADAAMALATASSQGTDPAPADIAALFAHGPITAGLEALTLDIGGAEFTGLGKIDVASPQDITGTAQITATNLDLLQQRVAAEPNLVQAGPVIIFLKGIGRTVGNQMVWDITYRPGRVLVNNQDMSALMGAAAPPPAPPPQPAPQQARPFPPAPGPQGNQPQLRRRQ